MQLPKKKFIKMSKGREQFLIKLMKYMNIPYVWGGKDLITGLDCSGLIYNILKNDLQLEPTRILNSQSYYDYFKFIGRLEVLPGASDLGDLCFFGKDNNNIIHVGMCLDNKLMIEAAHGGKDVVNVHIAALKGAKVEVNPISRRNDLRAILRHPNLKFD